MKTKLRANKFGFTVVEVMVVLAVTGILFISVITLISGRQAKTQFQASLNDIKSKLVQISNEVNSGYFPYDATKSCDASAGSVSISGAGPNNGSCAYIGKAVHFSTVNPTQFSTFTLVGYAGVGVTFASSASQLANYVAAKPTVMSSITASDKLQYGLAVTKMTYTLASSPTTPVATGSFAFMQSLNQNGVNTTGNYGGLSQHPNLLVYTGFGSNPASAITRSASDETISLNGATSYALDGTLTICFKSGTTNQWGIISIKSETSQLDITSQITSTSCS